jgi:hypothetical protein
MGQTLRVLWCEQETEGDPIMIRAIAIALLGLLSMQTASVEDVTPIDQLERGMSATIRGRVTRILDEDEFRIEDATGSIRVYIGWRNRVMIPVGEEVRVRGFVDNDLWSIFRPEFYAYGIIRQDGTVIQLDKLED